jgi:hypothetical protein
MVEQQTVNKVYGIDMDYNTPQKLNAVITPFVLHKSVS